jgi:hypothetical protein
MLNIAVTVLRIPADACSMKQLRILSRVWGYENKQLCVLNFMIGFSNTFLYNQSYVQAIQRYR